MVMASVKATPCFLRFSSAFWGSHSNSTGRVYRDEAIMAWSYGDAQDAVYVTPKGYHSPDRLIVTCFSS
jgi:hypothetical protein